MQTSTQQLINASLGLYTGTLLHAAQVRTSVLDGEHTVPVLCIDVELDNVLHTHLRAEQPFAPGQHAAAQAAAHRLKKGTRVTVHAPLVGLRLLAGNTTHIQLQPDAAASTQPATPTTPELFA